MPPLPPLPADIQTQLSSQEDEEQMRKRERNAAQKF